MGATTIIDTTIFTLDPTSKLITDQYKTSNGKSLAAGRLRKTSMLT
jgi:hypothetical protein